MSEHLIGAAQIGATYMKAPTSREALNTPYLKSPDSWVFDGRISLADMGKTWEAAFWIKNLTNEQHAIQVTDDGDSEGYRMDFNNPRTYGVSLSKHFN